MIGDSAPAERRSRFRLGLVRSGTPPGVSSTFTRHTKITAGSASTPQERQQIADDQAHREAAASTTHLGFE
jgi:hypothetical protein